MKIALPNKGRLYEPCMQLFERAGLRPIDAGTRKLFAKTPDPDVDILFARVQDIPEYVQDSAADMGVTGYDLVMETRAKIEVLLDLKFGVAELVLAVPSNSRVKAAGDLRGRRVATEFPNLASKFFREKGVDIKIVEVSGAAEMTPHVGIADAIVDLTSSGTTLSVNRLRIVERILSTSAKLIASKESMKRNRGKIKEVQTALESVIQAEGKRYIMMNVPKEALEKVKKVMPGLTGPTVMQVEAAKPTVAVHAVVDEEDVFNIINELQRVGARDILVVPIERMVR